MANLEALLNLEAILTALDGPDREVDLLIGKLWPGPDGDKPFSMSVNQQRGRKPPVLAFTASVDAALSLCERLLRKPPFMAQENETWNAEIPWDGVSEFALEANHRLLAIALCLAIVRALIAVEERKE